MRFAVFFLLAFLFFAATAFSQSTWCVPDDFPKIQDAISSESVADGDTVIVKPGTYTEALMEAGAHVLTRAQVMEGIPEMIHDIQVEATFPDGSKLVTVHNPIR